MNEMARKLKFPQVERGRILIRVWCYYEHTKNDKIAFVAVLLRFDCLLA